MNRTRIPVSIDIGFGDVVYPNRERMNFPVLLDMEKPKVFVYSIYSVIAEKFEALTSLGIANSRYKDFYDIYILAKRFDMSGLKLKDAIQCTFVRRGTGMNDIVVFQDEFTMDIVRRNRWNAFVQKKKTMEKTLEITGMMCSHCEMAVKKALEAVDGVESADVSHEKGTAVVTLSKEVSNDVLKKTVEDKDYTVTNIK